MKTRAKIGDVATTRAGQQGQGKDYSWVQRDSVSEEISFLLLSHINRLAVPQLVCYDLLTLMTAWFSLWREKGTKYF